MIAMIAAIAEVFFVSGTAAITAMVTMIWKPGFKSECTEKSSKIGKSWPQLKT